MRLPLLGEDDVVDQHCHNQAPEKWAMTANHNALLMMEARRHSVSRTHMHPTKHQGLQVGHQKFLHGVVVQVSMHAAGV